MTIIIINKVCVAMYGFLIDFLNISVRISSEFYFEYNDSYFNVDKCIWTAFYVFI